MTPSEQVVVMVLVAVEAVPALRRRMPEGKVWPDVELVAELVYRGSRMRGHMVREMSAEGTLFRTRLVEVVGSARQVEDAPFMLRPLRVAPRVVEAFHGAWRLDPEVADVAAMVTAVGGELLMPPEISGEVKELVERGSEGPLVLLAGPEGSGRKSLVAQASRQVLSVRCADLPEERRELARKVAAVLREARLFGAVPVFDEIDALGSEERMRVLERAIAEYPGPVAATTRRTGAAPISLARGVAIVEVPVPGETERAALWKRVLGDAASDETCAKAGARYAITAGTIARSAAAIAGRRARPIGDREIHRGVRSALDARLGSLGTRIEIAPTWDDLVLPDETHDEIRELVARVQHRRLVHDTWGFAGKIGRGLGVSALFHGPPGTGKTMVAGLIAKTLELDLYQIDLSRIVSKWIGETEKNLAQVFDAAESGHAILLFDEADSLFAKRTEVKSSVDRYANLEVNYLLQRMEAFRGISILTTNLEASIDEAFRRRLSARVHFPVPDAPERLRLWRTLVPTTAALAGDTDFDTLADRYAMSGGYIGNAALRAAFLAASESKVIGMTHLIRAASLEYAAMGKVMHGAVR
ncbi:MAG: AAA family ATPase [Deltaproteobacteria bacterium]|nr:AAA family ATPase [Deltaproteobacteria bacterium]